MNVFNRILITKCVSKIIYKNLHNKTQKISESFVRKNIAELRKMALPISRENPIIMKLESPEFKSIFTEELTSLVSLYKKYGYELRVAGGAVRDLLMGKTPKDLDFATTATPTQMKEMFSNENVRMINMNGEKHGTITPRINDKENFEVTTLRVDVVTDGRHAEVEFTTDWLLDANRRDLTINSMFLGFDGSVYDYFYGYDDLQKRRIAFVGSAATRIQEDYLRILRYFRFYGRFAEQPNGHEKDTLLAIQNNVQGLKQISGERIWSELKQILVANYACEILLTMLNVGIGPYIGLPSHPNVKELENLWNRSKNLNLQAITIITPLLKSSEELLTFHNRMKLSAYERDMALFLIQHRDHREFGTKPLLPYQQLLIKGKVKQTDLREWIIELLKYNNTPLLDEFKNWKLPHFPVSGTMLKEQGVDSGRFLGLVLNELKSYWAENNFTLDAEELLKQVPHIISVLKEKKVKSK